MTRLVRFLLGFLLATGVTVGSGGCGSKDEGQPNPDLKVPDVPPSPRGAKGDLKNQIPKEDAKQDE